ncbi:MAG: aminotransferase class I/II-fold pyridoxal phosphate-dependent enzyme [Candidatus Midichloria sp.]|nr:aminotransferase class I/II-fold pyridoxal phosphate-dependent enzyme [Candidatus Midichloria sp.]
MQNGNTKYTPVDGTLALKQAVQDKFVRENNLKFDLDQITVGSGAKQVIFNALLASLSPGDEVIIPAPGGFLSRNGDICWWNFSDSRMSHVQRFQIAARGLGKIYYFSH